MSFLSNSTFLISFGLMMTLLGTISFSFGMMFYGEERNEKKQQISQQMADLVALAKEREFSIADSSIDIIADIPEESLLKFPEQFGLQGEVNVLMYIYDYSLTQELAQVLVNGRWSEDFPGFKSIRKNSVSFSSLEKQVQLIHMEPIVSYADPMIRKFKSGEKYRVTINIFTRAPAILVPKRFVLRTKEGQTHVAESFKSEHKGVYEFVLVVP
ncbi:hypothetical protein ACES2I_05385 [Bdellovibrio bacteriovorus]|uniref:hypothetical protein n=1 Tax=Bdellovibrio bacteriovorus TaxID=959 RepID=UPI0035A647AB